MSKIRLELTIEETNVILEALGALPFARVYALIGRIQKSASEQVARSDAELDSNGVDRQYAR